MTPGCLYPVFSSSLFYISLPVNFLPLFHDLNGRPCLLVGGGSIACRKARLLISAGATIHLVSPYLCDEMLRIIAESSVTLEKRAFQPSDLEGMALVIAATDQPMVNQQVAELASKQQKPVNVVDQPELCTVIMPAIIDRSPIMVAVSSGGTAPVLARNIRTRLEGLLPQGLGRLAELSARFRQQVKMRFKHLSERRRFWEAVYDGEITESVLSGNTHTAEQLIRKKLQNPDKKDSGEVYLVGAGPGDPDLLTFKALRLMQKADIVLYDNLVSHEIVELCRRDAEFIYVGKKSCCHAVPQERINSMMIEFARDGKRVVRLKGGDPFIFGRGGEELEVLAAHDVPFQVVPGITAASGCASYAGIPLTHRDYAHSVRFITGHGKAGSTKMPWTELKDTQQTLVFYMGIKNLEKICQNLMAEGCSPERPVAIIHRGTTERQKTVTGTLATISRIAQKVQIEPPSLIVIGDVVRLHKNLDWYRPAEAYDLPLVQ
uniref:siroheme synthase CysG n=1 Tax=Endozoicomonas sp. Mp262 TaxID=2919499 RepID=UPI00351B00D4